MVAVRIVALGFSLIFSLFACSTTSQVGQQNRDDVPIIMDTPDSISSTQNLYKDNQYANIDIALSEGSKFLVSRIPEGTKIAVVNIQSPTKSLSEYTIDSISMYLINGNKFTVIERVELDVIRNEQMYQASGEVSDETAISIGKQIGARFIVTGSLLPLDNKYSLRIKIIDAETAQNFGIKILQFSQDRTILALLKTPALQETAKQETPRQEATTRPIINGDVNITNNNTTTINGDVYVNKPDWFDPNSFFE